MESIESKTPPRPKINVPESFVCPERFITDSTKSPKIEDVAIKNPMIISFQICPKTSGNKIAAIIPMPTEPTYPPKNPTRLLLGLALINPRVDFPIVIPKNHAVESQRKTIKKKSVMK